MKMHGFSVIKYDITGTTYRYNKVAILGSRDQLCVNPAVMEASNSREKLPMCQVLIFLD